MTKYGINCFVIIQKYFGRLIGLSSLFMFDPKHDRRYQYRRKNVKHSNSETHIYRIGASSFRIYINDKMCLI